MADYKPGEMDITEQKKMYGGFLNAVIWITAVVIIALIFLAIVGI